MTPYLSDKIKVMSALCIILVVWIHTYYVEGEVYTSTSMLMGMLGCGVSLYGVPTFYAISGYLFFLGTSKKGIRAIFTKQKKRVRTLLVPYVLTNIISIVFYLLVKVVASKNQTVAASLNFNLLDKGGETLIEKAYFWFWDGPIAFQMWFVRDLMIMIVLSPVIYYVLKVLASHRWTSYTAVISCLALVDWHYTAQIWAFAWFALGGILSMSKYLCIVDLKPYKYPALLMLFISHVVIFNNALCAARLSEFPIDIDYVTILGVPAVWILYDCFITNSHHSKLLSPNYYSSKLITSTFFIYLIHEPFLNVVKKLPLMVNRSECMIDLCYLLVPIVFVFFSVTVGNFWKKNLPKSYSFFVGGR